MQGFRLRAEAFQTIRPKAGRLPSSQLGLHLERSGPALRLWDPTTSAWLPTPEEVIGAERQKAEAGRQRADGLAAEVERLKKLLSGKTNGHRYWRGRFVE